MPREDLIGQAITAAGIFDAEFYKRAYTDVASSKLTPIDHFVKFGLEAGRQPSMGFDPVAYANRYPDIDGPAQSALHYAYFGRTEGRKLAPAAVDPSRVDSVIRAISEAALFDADFYREANPVVGDLAMDPLYHYLVTGHRTYAEPGPGDQMKGYLGMHPEVRETAANPLAHWISNTNEESRLSSEAGRSVSPWKSSAHSLPLPDDAVHLELMAGIAYFAGQGFDFSDRGTPATIARSVAGMARRTPLMSIDARAPKVSIIVPVYGQTPFVLNCLDSLARHASRHSVEIIVADDASPADALTPLLAEIPWIRYERRVINGGFLECCNSAVESSRGEYVVLLNSDTRVVPGWLDELIDGFELFPKAGMTGSKLFNDDATLQEAGGIFWRDGSAHNYGRGDDPNRPQYCHARQADFISGASIALRQSVWRELGGFDALYRPAYCEDADLAFRLRRRGYEVWYLPTSRAIHYEGVTHGRDTSKGVKAYQVENLKKFALRFAAELLRHPMPGTSSVAAASWRTSRHILFIDALTPQPDQDSGSIVTDEVMRTCRALGFGESFLPLHHPVYLGQPTRRLQRLGVCCHYEPYSRDAQSVLARSSYFDYSLLYRYSVAEVCHAPLRELSPSTRIIFANVDLHYLRESRAAATLGDESGVFKAAVTKSRELAMFASADASFVHTEIEKTIIQAEMPRPLKNVVVFPWLAEVNEGSRAFESRADIMFLGSFPHEPNVDSIKLFMESIWPSIVDRLPPQARLLVVGNKPPPEVMAMASERVIVTGYVEDLQPYFESARVFVAPLRYGAGIKGKLVTALAHGVPSVATSIAAEGIGSDDSDHLRIADEPAAFAEEVMRLYTDPILWSQVRAAGLAFVQNSYSREAAARLCREAMRLADACWMERQEAHCKQTLRDLLDIDRSVRT